MRTAQVGFLTLVVLMPLATSADGTYVKEGGGTVTPLSNDEVQLVREEIDIAVERPHLLAPDSTLSVTVTYVFRNKTDRPLSVDMGFPLRYDRSLQYLQGPNYFQYCLRNPISAFRAGVNGRDVTVRLRRAAGMAKERLGCRRVSEERGQALQEKDNAGLKQQKFAEYQVWTIKFAPRQGRTVTNRFRYAAQRGIYRKGNGFVYVLRTGAAWKDAIEQAAIRVRLNDQGCLMEDADAEGEHCMKTASEDPKESEGTVTGTSSVREDPYSFPLTVPSGVTPPKAEIRRTATGGVEVIWTLKNLEPAEDVRFTYETALAARRSVRASIAKLAQGKAERQQLQEARHTLLALYGIRLSDPVAQKRLAKRSWYVVDRKMTRTRLLSLDPLLRRLESRLK